MWLIPGHPSLDTSRYAQRATGHFVKYRVAIIVSLVLAAILVADGFIRTSRTRHHVSVVKTNVGAMSEHELTAAVRECDPPEGSGEKAKHDGDFCAEVTRALDAQPLQITTLVEPTDAIPLPQKVTPVAPLPPSPSAR
jgi:hypothetical protein